MMRTPPRNIRDENKDEKKNAIQKEGEEIMDLTGFQNSRESLKSPVLEENALAKFPSNDGIRRIGERNTFAMNQDENLEKNSSKPLSVRTYNKEILTPTNVVKKVSEQAQRGSTRSSPRLEQIERMRTVEEDSLMKCVAILRKMEQALERQRNVSKDIKEGVGELNEQMDVIASCRRTWKELELVRIQEAENAARISKENKLQLDEHKTPVTGRAKRAASSPVAPDTLKKVRENGEEGL